MTDRDKAKVEFMRDINAVLCKHNAVIQACSVGRGDACMFVSIGEHKDIDLNESELKPDWAGRFSALTLIEC
jgi:hypothetical protein